MEILIVVAIMTVVVKRGVEDVIHTAKGGTPPRYAAASARRKSGAASRYWGQLWDDAWGDLSKRHAEKRAKRDIHAPRPDRDPSKMRTVLATAGDDIGRWARATWRHGWDKLDQKQQVRRLRDRPGRQTVPGKVVPNAPSRPEGGSYYGNCDRCGKRMLLLRDQTTCARCQYELANPHHDGPLTQDELDWARWAEGPEEDTRTDEQIEADILREHGSRQQYRIWGQPKYLDPDPESGPDFPSQDGDGDRPEDRPRPEPHVVQDEDGRTDLRFGEDEDDPTGVSSCPECGGTGINQDGGICESCRDRQEQRNQHYEGQSGPDSGPDNRTSSPLASTTTQEGTTMTTTIPTGTEVVGLDPAIDYCATTVQACTAMQHSLDHTEAAVIAGGVTGVATAAFAQAKELFGQIARVMEGAGQEFVAYKAGQEFYDANPGAGTKEWLTAGR